MNAPSPLFHLVSVTPEQRDAYAALEAQMAKMRRIFSGSSTTPSLRDSIGDEALTLMGLAAKLWEARS